jgi:pectinesterase
MKTIVVKKQSKVNCLSKALELIDEGGTVIVFPGKYEEKLKIKKSNIKIIGFDPVNTIITFHDYAQKIHEDGKEFNTFRTYSLMLYGDNIELKNLTIENSSGPGKLVGQAVALHTLGDNLKISNCILKAHQDTIFLGPLPDDLRERYQGFLPKDELIGINNARILFENSTIIGDVDFIFGSANAMFSGCRIISRGPGYVAAPSTASDQEFGITFLNCTFEGTGEENTYLARPWRNYGKAVFIDCFYHNHIKEEGFHNWEAGRENTCRFYEYNCRYHNGTDFKRVDYLKKLTAKEREIYSIETFFNQRG